MKYNLIIILLTCLYEQRVEFLLIRHGARSPTTLINENFVYYTENKPGNLTLKGFNESIQHGRQLKISRLMSINENNTSIFVSHVKRCQETSEAYLIGMKIDSKRLLNNKKLTYLQKNNDKIFNIFLSKEKIEIIKNGTLINKNNKIIEMLWENIKKYDFLTLIKNFCIGCNPNPETYYDKLRLIKSLNSIIYCLKHENLLNIDIPLNLLLEVKKSAFIFYDKLLLRNIDIMKKIANGFLYIIGNKLFNYLTLDYKLIHQKFAKKSFKYNLNSQYFLFFGHDLNLITFLKLYFDTDQFIYFNDNIPKFNSFIHIKLIELKFTKNIFWYNENLLKTKYYVNVNINNRDIYTNKCNNLNCTIEKFMDIISEYTN